MLRLAFAVLVTSLAAQGASAQAPCPAAAQQVNASNGSSFTCGPVPAPREASAPAPGAYCPSAAHDIVDSHGMSMVGTRVRDLTIASVAINNKPMKVRVILPRDYSFVDYAAEPSKVWPVLYLLTGHGASYESWTCGTRLLEYAKELNVIIVMPEGTVGYMREAVAYTPDGLSGLGAAASGVPGWYSNWQSDLVQISNHTVYGPRVRMRLATHHTLEVRDILNANFHANNEKYAVAGLSMGGFGAATYALGSTASKPFVAAAMFSGPLDTEYLSANIPYIGGLDMPSVIRGSIEVAQAAQGEYLFTGNRLWGEKTSFTWRQNNPKRRVASSNPLDEIPLYVSAGQGNTVDDIDLVARMSDGSLDPVEVGAYFSTQSFLYALNRSDITTEFFPRGGHQWPNWDVAICRALNLTLLAPLATASTPVGSALPLASCPTLP
jgi:diacylglycerol O-acyltransferase/trehalose O-mycolyltransferase